MKQRLVRTHARFVRRAGGRCQAQDLVRSCLDLLCNLAFAINAPIARKLCTHAPSIKVNRMTNHRNHDITRFFLVLELV